MNITHILIYIWLNVIVNKNTRCQVVLPFGTIALVHSTQGDIYDTTRSAAYRYIHLYKCVYAVEMWKCSENVM